MLPDREDESLSDPDRYESAAGWEPKDVYAKLRKLAREQFTDHGTSPFEIDSASKSAAKAANRTPAPLFGDLWQTGEVAVLFGEPGIGKTVLATQIAETIARGIAFAEMFPAPKSQPVVYFDFELTAAQFRERYSVHTGGHKRRRLRYQFSPRLKRATMRPIRRVPGAFKGDGQEYVRFWFDNEIALSQSAVFVIDNISYLTRSKPDATLIRNLKQYAAQYGMSFLVIAPAREKRTSKDLKLADAAVHRNIIDQADSVFALAPSTCGEEIRYLKHLKSRTAEPQFTDQNVAVLRLERTTGPQASCFPGDSRRVRSPHVSKGHSPNTTAQQTEYNVTTANTKSAPPSPLLPISPSPRLLHSPTPPTPFLGFTYLGTSSEHDQNRDYLAEFLKLTSAPARGRVAAVQGGRPLSAKDAIVEGLLNGSYGRYMLGD